MSKLVNIAVLLFALGFLWAHLCSNLQLLSLECGSLLFHLQGVNPWIEVDGGVTPNNAYKVYSFESDWY